MFLNYNQEEFPCKFTALSLHPSKMNELNENSTPSVNISQKRNSVRLSGKGDALQIQKLNSIEVTSQQSSDQSQKRRSSTLKSLNNAIVDDGSPRSFDQSQKRRLTILSNSSPLISNRRSKASQKIKKVSLANKAISSNDNKAVLTSIEESKKEDAEEKNKTNNIAIDTYRKKRHWGCLICLNRHNPIREKKCITCKHRRPCDRIGLKDSFTLFEFSTQ